MINKKGMSEIVTSILIILLVLGAIVIVWAVVSGVINNSADAANAKAKCLGITLSVASASSTASNETVGVVVKRGTDTVVGITGYKLLVVDSTGASVTCTSVDPVATDVPVALGQKSVNITGCAGLAAKTYTVQLAPKVGTVQCDITSSKDFTAV